MHGPLEDAARVLETLRVDEVLVTIPDAPAERVQAVVAACATHGVECRFVRRQLAAPPEPADAVSR